MREDVPRPETGYRAGGGVPGGSPSLRRVGGDNGREICRVGTGKRGGRVDVIRI